MNYREENGIEECKVQNKRIEYFDIAKGIGILLVILGHMQVGYLRNVIYSFHMPMFFVCSGFFLNVAGETSLCIKKKARQLLVPYYTTCILIIIISVIFNLTCNNSFSSGLSDAKEWILSSLYASGNLQPFGIKRIGAIWFLWALFWALCINRLIVHSRFRAVYVLIVFIVGVVSAYFFWLPLSIQAGMAATLYTYFGVLCREKRLFDRKIPFYLFALLFVAWAAYAMVEPINLSKCYFPYSTLSLLGSLVGVYLFIELCKYISLRNCGRINNYFCYLGKNSLTIMCFHLIELNLFPWSRFNSLLYLIVHYKALIIAIDYLLKVIYVNVAVYCVNHISFLSWLYRGEVKEVTK